MNKKLIFIFLILYFFYYRLPALDPNQRVDQYLLDQWDTAHGFPGGAVNAIAQTPDGYLWLATPKGPVQFDGLKFSILRVNKKGESKDKKNTYVDRIFVDKQGFLWIGNISRLRKYNYQTGEFTTFTPGDGLPGYRIFCINEDMRGNLWIGFWGRFVSRLTGGTGKTNGKLTLFDSCCGLEGTNITSIIENMKGDLLVGTFGKGIFRFRDEKFSRYEIEGLTGNLIYKIYEDRKGTLWVATGKGLARVKDSNSGSKVTAVYTTRNGLSNNYILNILEDSDGNLWIGTFSGLTRMQAGPAGKTVFEKLLENHYISGLFEDKEKSIWIGTRKSGLMRLKNCKFISHTSGTGGKNRDKMMYSLFADRGGVTWIGCRSGELLKYKNGEFIETLAIAEARDTAITGMIKDSRGNMWIGTLGNGVFQRKEERFLQLTTGEGLANNFVLSLFIDSKNNLWIGTYDGVSRYAKGILESFTDRDGLLGKIVNNVYEDRNHNIWIATSEGINVIKSGRFTKNNMTEYLHDIPVTCIHEDKGVFWIGTHGAGLKRFENGTFITYTTAEGMTSNFIYQILADEQGSLWMMSDNGVLKASKAELNTFARGRPGNKINCTSFGLSDGLRSTQFNNKFSRHSAVKTGEGELWFVTKRGIAMVNPANIKINKFPPPVIIKNPRFPVGKDSNEIKDVVFHFTAATFLSPEKVIFKYKLEGYDKDWVLLPAGEARKAHYRNLPAGIYTFSVTACNSDGVWNRTGASTTFTIKSPFYKTTLFIIPVFLAFLLLALTAYFLLKKRTAGKPINEICKNSKTNPREVEECIKKLTYLMEIKKIYRSENISLQSLSEKLSVTPHQLSRIINTRLNRNFAEFVNNYRIREAKKILADPERASRKIFSIASDVGFNTKVAFNIAFKRYTKMTPTQYRKRVNG